MATDRNISAHTDHAARITREVLARPLPEGCCYAVANVHGEHEGFMPLVSGDNAPLTCAVTARITVDALATVNAARITSPRLVIVPVNRALAWIAHYL